MAVFWSYFWDFIGEQKSKDLSEFKNFFVEVIQVTIIFILTKAPAKSDSKNNRAVAPGAVSSDEQKCDN